MSQVSTELNIRLLFDQTKQLLQLIATSKQWEVANESDLCDPNMKLYLQRTIENLSYCSMKYAQYKDAGGSPNDYFH